MNEQIQNAKQQIRKQIRQRRKSLTAIEQQQFAGQIANHISTYIAQLQSEKTIIKTALFLSMDGEIGTDKAIKQLWLQQCEVYLPRIHPFNPNQLIFLRYQADTPLTTSKLGMKEPQLNCSQLCPIQQLDVIFTPLVAFDKYRNRLGMGGGFYDRTLSHIGIEQNPQIVGLAHNCQQVEQVPIEAWDIPLKRIITPNGLIS